MAKYVFTKKRRAALNKVRRKWMSMSPRARRKAMPSKVARPKKVYPVGQHMMLDVGRKGHHYVFVKKTKYGWKKVRPPNGVKQVPGKKGYVLLTKKARMAMTAKARKKWMSMPHSARVRAMPGGKK